MSVLMRATVVLALVLGGVACSSATPVTPTQQPSPTPVPTDTPPPATPTPEPSPTTGVTQAPAVTQAEISDFSIKVESEKVIISYKFSGKTADYNALKFFVDVDQSAGTGYKVGGLGAEFMAENAGLFAYKGDGSSWDWEQVTTGMEFEVVDNIVTWSVPKPDVKLSDAEKADFAAQLVNTNWDAVALAIARDVALK